MIKLINTDSKEVLQKLDDDDVIFVPSIGEKVINLGETFIVEDIIHDFTFEDTIYIHIRTQGVIAPENGCRTRHTVTKPKRTYDFIGELVFVKLGDAEDVVSAMHDMLLTYNNLSVADVKNICGLSPNFSDHKIGWTYPQPSICIFRCGEGYRIAMPLAEEFGS